MTIRKAKVIRYNPPVSYASEEWEKRKEISHDFVVGYKCFSRHVVTNPSLHYSIYWLSPCASPRDDNTTAGFASTPRDIQTENAVEQSLHEHFKPQDQKIIEASKVTGDPYSTVKDSYQQITPSVKDSRSKFYTSRITSTSLEEMPRTTVESNIKDTWEGLQTTPPKKGINASVNSNVKDTLEGLQTTSPKKEINASVNSNVKDTWGILRKTLDGVGGIHKLDEHTANDVEGNDVEEHSAFFNDICLPKDPYFLDDKTKRGIVNASHYDKYKRSSLIQENNTGICSSAVSSHSSADVSDACFVNPLLPSGIIQHRLKYNKCISLSPNKGLTREQCNGQPARRFYPYSDPVCCTRTRLDHFTCGKNVYKSGSAYPLWDVFSAIGPPLGRTTDAGWKLCHRSTVLPAVQSDHIGRHLP